MRKFIPKRAEIKEDEEYLNNESESGVEMELERPNYLNDDDSEFEQEDEPVAPTKALLTTVINKGAKILGDIIVEGNLEILGEVVGNVTSEAQVVMSGKITGNLTCNSASLNDGFISGNIDAKDNIYVGAATEIQGDMVTNSAQVFGKVKGNVDAKATMQVNSSGVIMGDVQAGELMVEKGAILQGVIKINRDVFFESIED